MRRHVSLPPPLQPRLSLVGSNRRELSLYPFASSVSPCAILKSTSWACKAAMFAMFTVFMYSFDAGLKTGAGETGFDVEHMSFCQCAHTHTHLHACSHIRVTLSQTFSYMLNHTMWCNVIFEMAAWPPMLQCSGQCPKTQHRNFHIDSYSTAAHKLKHDLL